MRKADCPRPILLVTCLCLASLGCYAADLQNGQSLHDADCLFCHDSSVYTRDNRRMQTMDQLVAQVKMCQEDVDAGWNAAQFEDVVAWLNSRYYKFADAVPAPVPAGAKPSAQ